MRINWKNAGQHRIKLELGIVAAQPVGAQPRDPSHRHWFRDSVRRPHAWPEEERGSVPVYLCAAQQEVARYKWQKSPSQPQKTAQENSKCGNHFLRSTDFSLSINIIIITTTTVYHKPLPELTWDRWYHRAIPARHDETEECGQGLSHHARVRQQRTYLYFCMAFYSFFYTKWGFMLVFGNLLKTQTININWKKGKTSRFLR